jgi:transcriptional regulator with XRE-family HTH domain
MVIPSLKQWRRARQLSRRELADQAAVSVATIARIEQGTTQPRPHIAHHLADALGTVPDLVAELAEAVPRLGAKRQNPAAGDDGPRDLIDQDQFPIGAPAQEPADERV